MRRALSVPNMADPGFLVRLAEQAEAAGWDGFFLWDHVHGSSEQPVPVADPWSTLGAVATRTDRLRLGTTITAIPRRRPHELARQTVTLDHLSDGRAVLGVGLGEPPEEYTAYGASPDRRELAARLDEGLTVLAGLWSGEPFSHDGEHYVVRDAQFVPRAVQQPRIPVWTSCVTQNRATLARAARWDGVILADLGADGSINPVAVDRVRDAVDRIGAQRPSMAGYEVAVTMPADHDPDHVERCAEAGATWLLVTGWLEELDALVGTVGAGASTT